MGSSWGFKYINKGFEFRTVKADVEVQNEFLIRSEAHFARIFGWASSRHKNLQWEKKLDEQREHRLQREGVFWHDATLDGLSDDDRRVFFPWKCRLASESSNFFGSAVVGSKLVPDVFVSEVFRVLASNYVGLK